MSLDYFQQHLQNIYEIDIPQRANDFLITDAVLANLITGAQYDSPSREQLLIAERHDGLDISIYISKEVMQMYEQASPEQLLHNGSFDEFCLTLEGVSHFIYLIWNASRDRHVTLFEMELQAEIDKFIFLHAMNRKTDMKYVSDNIGNWLFDQHQLIANLSQDEKERYERANYYAGKYCLRLKRQYQLAELNNDLLNELRRFYRFGREEKLRYINKIH
ncbi:MAG: hypothetical protein AAF419_04270 [Pseudomonadota bacterium]